VLLERFLDCRERHRHILLFITFDGRGASKYFDSFKVRTGIASCPHDFLESNPLISGSISSGVVGDKKK